MEIKQFNLNDVLNSIKRNEYQVPNFQRDFVWKKENITSLLDSIWKNYPIGALLALPMSKINLAHNPLSVKNDLTNQSCNKNNSFYVLDGQQRLTSLAIALVSGEFEIKKNKYAFYFNYENYALYLLKDHEEKYGKKFFDEEIFIEKDLEIFSCSEVKGNPSQIKDGHLVLTSLLLNNDFKRFFNEREFINLFVKRYKINENYLFEIESIISNSMSAVLYSYLIIFQFLDKNESIESICRIFETINSTGRKLTVLDLLVAKTFTNQFSLKIIVDSLEEALSDCYFNNEALLQIIFFVKRFRLKKSYSLTKEDLFKLESDDFNNEIINHLKSSLIDYKKFLINKRLHKGVLHSQLMVLIISSDISLRVSGKKSFFETHEKFIYDLILARAMKKTYNKTQSPNDYKAILDLISTETSEAEIYENHFYDRFFAEKFDKVDKWDLLKLNNKAKLNYIIYSLLYSNLNICIDGEIYEDISKLEEHHIIPYAIGNKENIHKDKINCIANKILIDSTLNKKISDAYPQKYMIDLYNKHGNLEVLKNHKLILFSGDIKNNFDDPDKFIEERAFVLANLINNFFNVKKMLAQ